MFSIHRLPPWISLVLLLKLVLVAGTSCRPSPDVHEIWAQHYSVLETADSQPEIDPGATLEAAIFFECLVPSIDLDVEPHILGPFVGDLSVPLQQLRDWYAENRENLVWDAGQGMVRVRQAQGRYHRLGEGCEAYYSSAPIG